MADDLTTISGIETVLAATAGYDVDGDVDLAKRRVAALRRKLDFAESSGRDGTDYRFNHQVIERQLRQALEYVAANQPLTEAQRKANPSVLHADFSATGKYAAEGS